MIAKNSVILLQLNKVLQLCVRFLFFFFSDFVEFSCLSILGDCNLNVS